MTKTQQAFAKMVERSKQQGDTKLLVLKLTGAAGDIIKAGQTESDNRKIIYHIGKFEHLLHSLLSSMGIKRTWRESSKRPEYTLPMLTEAVFGLCKAVGNKKNIIEHIHNIEETMADVYVVLERANNFDGTGELMTCDKVLQARINRFN